MEISRNRAFPVHFPFGKTKLVFPLMFHPRLPDFFLGKKKNSRAGPQMTSANSFGCITSAESKRKLNDCIMPAATSFIENVIEEKAIVYLQLNFPFVPGSVNCKENINVCHGF